MHAKLMPEQLLSDISLIATNSLGTGLWDFSWLRNVYCLGVSTCTESEIYGGEFEASTIRQPDSQVGSTTGWMGRLG